ncbi:MAG TPA: Rieske (2Fe-2S) protein [Chitinophagaceae bacterium]|jgi:Rieske Fe-S protein
MERKEFIQSACNACLLMAAGYLLPTMASCTPKYSVFKTDIIDDKILFPSVKFNQSSLQFVRPKGWYYDIAVEKNKDNTFKALLMQCTHQENQLTADGNGFHCNLHGSQFNKEGKVIKGPAENPLKQFPVSIDRDNLIIHLKP